MMSGNLMAYWMSKFKKKVLVRVVLWMKVLLWKAIPLLFTSMHNCSQGEDLLNRTAREVPLPGLLLNTVNVPQDTRVIHHNDERPDTLAFNSQLFQAVPLQFQVVVWQLLNEKPGSTWKATQVQLHVLHSGSPTDSSHSPQACLFTWWPPWAGSTRFSEQTLV